MQKFSASYGGTEENFIVKTNLNSNDKIDQNVYSILCVVQNILQRGNPTNPSEFLKSKLGDFPTDSKPVRLIDKTEIYWNNIRGDDQNGYYPARKFYYKIIPDYLGRYSFVKNLILPETEFNDILANNKTFNGQQVDFYLPQVKLVFEIDGSGHNEQVQMNKDKKRDIALREEGIDVIRIKTKDIENESLNFSGQMKWIENKLSKNDIIKEYAAALSVTSDDIRVKYDAVMRLQLSLLHCFKINAISLQNPQLNIKIVNSDVNDICNLLTLAYEDLKLWIKNIAQLAKINIDLPKLKIAALNDDTAITLDFCMFRRYSDTDKYWKSNIRHIYIRTDYFVDKNYFQVASANSIKYNFNKAEENTDDKSLKFILKELFGHVDFKSGQLQIIKHILGRNDTIGILPTGTGKSLCYQLTALLQPGINIVVVPIISLMQDQKQSMEDKGINRVANISGDIEGEAKYTFVNDFREGKYQFMIISPERLQNEKFRNSLREINQNLNISMVVLDEVHCLSEWGHDFRISYLMLVPTIRNYCPKACLLGLTATASQAVLNDLKAEFGNDGSGIKALSSMDREELIFKRIIVANDDERDKNILKIIQRHNKPYSADGKIKNSVGLIFCQTISTKNGCKEVQQRILRSNIKLGDVELFHGTLPNRMESQDRFMKKDFNGLMVCTTAFGMGIDKENIKYTIHNTLPKSIESFYQEAGRAGRDVIKEPKSYCYIIYKPDKINKRVIETIFKSSTDVTYRKNLCKKLDGDLKTVMYFLNLDKNSPEVECNNILKILEKIKNAREEKGFKIIEFDDQVKNNISLSSIQNALHKLFLLGIVKDWTISHYNLNKGQLNINYLDIDIERAKNSLLKYINNHDAEFTLEGGIEKYKQYYELLKADYGNALKNLLLILIKWTNDVIFFNRLQSSKNMMTFCSSDVSDEEFRKNLNDFFKCTEQTVIFDTIVQRPLEYNNWFDILTVTDEENETNVINVDKAKSTSISLLRYLESYPDNTGFNYLSGMLRLICSDYEGTEGEWRLDESLHNIKENNKLTDLDKQKIVDRTLNIAKNFKVSEKNMISEILLKYYPNNLTHIQEILHDDYSLSLIIDNATAQVKCKLEEKINGLLQTTGTIYKKL